MLDSVQHHGGDGIQHKAHASIAHAKLDFQVVDSPTGTAHRRQQFCARFSGQESQFNRSATDNLLVCIANEVAKRLVRFHVSAVLVGNHECQ